MPPSLPPDSGPSPVRARAFSRWDPRRATIRAAVSATVGVVVGLALPHTLSGPTRLVAGWNVASFTLLSLSWFIIWTSDSVETHARAASVDPGRTAVWSFVILSGLLGLFAATVVLHEARHCSPTVVAWNVGLALAAVVCAWSLTHTSYTLRYAHLYYRDDREGVGGLEFPGGRAPDYVDFAYFAFTIGMTFQVSDVCISSPTIRRAALGHAMLAFGYNTAILALALNLVSGLFG